MRNFAEVGHDIRDAIDQLRGDPNHDWSNVIDTIQAASDYCLSVYPEWTDVETGKTKAQELRRLADSLTNKRNYPHN